MKFDLKKRKIIIISILFAAIILCTIFLIMMNFSVRTCNDGSVYGECSEIQPYYCFMGRLIERAPICGCSNLSVIDGNQCKLSYGTEKKIVTLNYTLRGKSGQIEFPVYKGVYDYLSGIPRYYDFNENHTLLDFRINMLNNEIQREYLLPLVVEVQKITPDKEDQARIILSLGQNIPFGSSDKIVRLGGITFDYQRYPYEVLYDLEGVCGEKSELIIFMLREIGYGSAFLYYAKENHEAVGIKCSKERGVDDSEFCFVETTGPSIISDDKTEYIGFFELTSVPKILIASEGFAFGKYEVEYIDAKNMNKIRNSVRDDGLLDPIQYLQFQVLKEKYGLNLFE